MAPLRDALQDIPEGAFFDLYESEEGYLLLLDLPGATSETVDCAIEDGRIFVDAKREKSFPEEYRYTAEHRSLFLDVTLPMPGDADEDRASASVEGGVLELELPKRGSQMTIDVREE